VVREQEVLSIGSTRGRCCSLRAPGVDGALEGASGAGGAL